MTELIGNLGAAFVLVMWLALAAFGFAIPLIAWSITRNVKKIRLQLERLNDTLERGGTPPSSSSSSARPGALGI